MKKSVQSIINQEIKLLLPDSDALKKVKEIAGYFLDALEKELERKHIDADVFVGGSFAKGTFIKSDKYDVDVFVRFDWKYEQLSELLEPILIRVAKDRGLRVQKVHGSRDYFRVMNGDSNGYFEVIPVTRIKKPHEERNVTDLSYFHVPYVKKNIKGFEDQVRLAKQFFKAQGVYGAETYVKGFSGYTVELLIIYYKSFLKMLRALVKIKDGERAVIDLAKHYKNKTDVFIQLNEAKLHSPIILIDPTYKERNALAALSHETFAKLQKAAREFLKRPSLEDFVKKPLNVKFLSIHAFRKKLEFVHLSLETDKQAGDIAGTKLKKFSEMLIEELGIYFDVRENYFSYSGEQNAEIYILAKSRREIVRIGPPLIMKKHVAHFKAEHLNTFVKGKFIHARIPIIFNLRSYLDVWQKANEKKLREMHITAMEIVD
ncbi:MAG: nucleotidyltransferase domain-containing protein [Nanoarchaeota archaeon]